MLRKGDGARKRRRSVGEGFVGFCVAVRIEVFCFNACFFNRIWYQMHTSTSVPMQPQDLVGWGRAVFKMYFLSLAGGPLLCSTLLKVSRSSTRKDLLHPLASNDLQSKTSFAKGLGCSGRKGTSVVIGIPQSRAAVLFLVSRRCFVRCFPPPTSVPHFPTCLNVVNTVSAFPALVRSV